MANLSDTQVRRRAGMLTTMGRVVGGFGALIAVGTVLLQLPMARVDRQPVAWVDALFVATSATCVTGLSPVNLAETYTFFGQAVILGLIQLGGLGLVVAGSLFLLARSGGTSLATEDFIGANVGRLRWARPVDLFFYACFVVLSVELIGMVGLTHLILAREGAPEFDEALWQAAFHSVSAFCNAGLSIHKDGLVEWRHEPAILGLMSLLVVMGGVGLLTLVNFRYWYWWRTDRMKQGHLTLQTRVCLLTTLVLLVLGTLLSWLSEWDGTLKDEPWWRGLLWSWVHSTMTRSSGFNVVDVGEMSPITLLGSMVLMFIGGAPGSMAGGIKVTSLVLLGVVAWSALKRRSDLVLGRHTVPQDQASNAVMVTLLSAAALVLVVGMLMNVEANQLSVETPHHWLALVFEAVSAFCTVGLSTGITELLTPWGKLILVVVMFVGRLGPLCLAMHLSRPAQPARITYPREEISVG